MAMRANSADDAIGVKLVSFGASEAFSCSIWARKAASQTADYPAIVVHNYQAGAYPYTFKVKYEGGVITADFKDATSIVTSGDPLSTSAWTHLVVTAGSGSPTNRTGRLYVNGVEIGTGTTVGALPTDELGLRISGQGALPLSSTIPVVYFTGDLGEFALWQGTELSSGQVTSLYNSGNGVAANTIGTPTFYLPLYSNYTDTMGNASPTYSNSSGGPEWIAESPLSASVCPLAVLRTRQIGLSAIAL